MEKTSIEWLAEQLLTKYRLKIDNYQEFKQAKEMEKQEIIEAYHKAQLSLIEVVIESFEPNEKNDLDDKNDAEQYYNEKLKNK